MAHPTFFGHHSDPCGQLDAYARVAKRKFANRRMEDVKRMEEKENHPDDPCGSGAEVAKSRKQFSSSLKCVGAQKAAASCKRKFQAEADGSRGLESCLPKKRFCGRHRG